MSCALFVFARMWNIVMKTASKRTRNSMLINAVLWLIRIYRAMNLVNLEMIPDMVLLVYKIWEILAIWTVVFNAFQTPTSLPNTSWKLDTSHCWQEKIKIHWVQKEESFRLGPSKLEKCGEVTKVLWDQNYSKEYWVNTTQCLMDLDNKILKNV